MKKQIMLTAVLFLLASFKLFTQDRTENLLISKTDSLLMKFVELKKEVEEMHPCLSELQPIAIAYNDSLLIFDYNSTTGSYGLVKKQHSRSRC